MKTIFEPSDGSFGSFEIYLDTTEPFPVQQNVDGVAVWRLQEGGSYLCIKDYHEILVGLEA